MSSFHTTSDAAFFSCGEDQTTAWSQVTGHNQHTALAFDGSAAGPIAPHDLDWIFAPVINDLVNTGIGLSGLEAASTASNACYSYPPNFPGQYNPMNTDSLATGLAPTPALMDSDTVTSSPSDALWGEADILSALPVAGPQGNTVPCGYSAAALPFQAESAWSFQPGQFAGLVPSYTVSHGPVMTSCAPDFDFTSPVGTVSWGSAQIKAPPFGLVEMGSSQTISPVAYIPASTRGNLGKCRRSAETSHDHVEGVHEHNTRGPIGRVKRKTRTNGVLEAAGSTSRARQKPSTRTPVQIDDKSEAAERGAGKLAAANAQEVYHQFLPGPSVQGELMWTTVQGQLPWVEGSEEGVTRDFTGNVEEEQDVVSIAEDAQGDGFRIPRGLKDRHRKFLKATPDEWARGVVRVLKCITCPRAGFSKWDAFTRHCDKTEGHLKHFVFCRFCGDYFGRPDSRDRHEENRPEECLRVSPIEAEEKRKKTLEVYEEHKAEAEAHLKFGGAIGENFSQRMKKLYPNSSKRGSRQQNRLKVRRVKA